MPVPLVDAKTTVPSLPRRLVARPRLAERLAELIAAHRVVAVLATAGAGKTTAVVEALGRLEQPIAWLTLDDAERAPGRLLLYLENAVCRALPSTSSVAVDALAAGVGHAETAALLAEAMPDGQAIVVIDEVERLADAPEALAVLASFIRYARTDVSVVLVGRRDVLLDIGSRVAVDDVARLHEHELAFSLEEVEETLELRGLHDIDATVVIQATGGWAAGVLFEAWKPDGAPERPGGTGDPLAGYLGDQILGTLDEQEREFLVVTSLFSDVDARSARSLGQADADEMLMRLADRYLPVTWTERGMTMRCHPRFRDHLRSVLLGRDAETVRALRTRHAMSLIDEGQYEEAVVELLAIDGVSAALEPAVRALPAIIARQDVQLAADWLKRFDAAGLARDAGLLSARLALAITLEEFGRAVEAADQLQAAGYPPAGEERALAAWAYWHVGRLDDARATLDDAPPGGAAQVVNYLFSLVDCHPPDVLPQPTGGPLDALLLRIMFARGRLAEVRDAPVSDWMPAGRERISVYRALGELDRTQEMLGAPAGALHNLRTEGTVRAELMMDLGHEAEARQALLRGRATLVRSGSFVFDVISRVLAAKLELRMCRDADRGLAILHGAETAGPTRRYGHLAEQVDVWTGYALLLRGDDRAARERLRSAVESMLTAERILELPTAGIYLAEAEWRTGSSDAADTAADVALDAAQRQGSMHLLFQAIADLPAVAARRLDSEPTVDGPWHEVARSRAAAPRRGDSARAPMVQLQAFGAPYLLVDGVIHRARIAKTYALLDYLVSASDAVIRDELLDALFDGRSDASSKAYLRQAIHGLRQLLPEGLDIVTTHGGLVLSDPARFETDALLLEARLESAARLGGTRRFDAVASALQVAAPGPFLSGIECSWVHQRRSELAALITESRIGMAVGAFEDSRFDLAEPVLERVLSEDPHRERAWRLLMRIAVARGSDDDLIALYRRCELALRDVGLEPSEPTRLLVAGLRR